MIDSASFPVWGSTAVVAVSEADRLAAAVDVVRRTVDAFDLACSRFREDSELAALNRAGGRPLPVSSLLMQAVKAAVRAAQLTGGDVDPTLGSALIALGYDRDFDQIRAGRPEAVKLNFLARPGWRTIRIDEPAGTVALDRDVRLDLGATAKALAADQAAAAASRDVGCGALVSLGGDLAIAGVGGADGWRVRVTDDHRAGTEAPGQWITLDSGGLATSSTSVRRWRAGAETVHHLLDPATGRPVSGAWRTVSVAATDCLDANIASTAAIIRGRAAPEWLESLHLPSRLVSEDGHVLRVAGWPAEGEDLPLLQADWAGVGS